MKLCATCFKSMEHLQHVYSQEGTRPLFCSTVCLQNYHPEDYEDEYSPLDNTKSRATCVRLVFLIVLTFWVLVALLGRCAMAQSIGQGLICDSQSQIREFIASADKQGTLTAINERDGKGSCGMATFSFDALKEVERVPAGNKLYTIILLHIIAFKTPAGIIEADSTQYTLSLNDGRGA